MDDQLPSPADDHVPTIHVEASGDEAVAVGRDVSGILQTGDGAHAIQYHLGPTPAPGSVDPRPGLNSLPFRTDLFVGRTQELSRLDLDLGASRNVAVQVVHGLGGVGKSTLVAHWAATREHNCYPVRWITAESSEDIQQGLAAFASDLEPALVAKLAPEARAMWALQWLATHNEWLLILDNVNQPSDIEPLLARASGGRFLITTRFASGWHGTPTISLGVLSESEAVDLFRQVMTSQGERDLNGAVELCAALGYLPLAIAQAAAYLNQSPFTSPREYLDLLVEYPAKMYRARAVGVGDDRTIAKIWRITLDRINEEQPLAADLLRAMAWYAPVAIPETLPSALLIGQADPPEINAALGLLVAYGMITAQPEDRTYLMHRLVQAYLRTPDTDDPHRSPELIGAAALLSTHMHSAIPTDDGPATWKEWDRIIPHIEHLLQGLIPESYDVATVMHDVGIHFLDRGQPGRALAYLDPALEGVVQLFGKDNPIALTYRHNLAGACKEAGEWERAISLFEETLNSRELVLGVDHPETITTRASLASTYAEAGKLDVGLPMLEVILEDREKELGDEHPETVEARHNVACAYRDTGRLELALQLLEKVVDDADRFADKNNLRLLIYRHNLASLLEDLGDSDRAIPMMKESLDSTMAIYGEDHHHTALAYNCLANAYSTVGDLDYTIQLYEKALAIAMRVLGENHYHTLIIRNNFEGASRRRELERE